MAFHSHRRDNMPSGFFINGDPSARTFGNNRKYLPLLSLDAKASILSSIARTTFTQTFSNPLPENIPKLQYTFPLFDGVSVASFTCTVNDERVIKGVVQEKQQARQTFENAKARGETAGLLEQSPSASDVFTTSVGNVPGNAVIKVEIVVLGELKHDAETDGIRFTIPTHIAPRYGAYPSVLGENSGATAQTHNITIAVDVEMPVGSAISLLQSPSHFIGISLGVLSASPASNPSPNLASAVLALGTAALEKDFILQIVAANTDNPVALLENHPTIPNQRALMTTLVPKFSLPTQRPEIVFICDRSGSMGGTKIMNLRSALQLFLKSLPLGVKFNICGFGSSHGFLFPESQPYDSATLDAAMKYAYAIDASLGGTEIRAPIIETFKRRQKDMDLEAFLLTDGEVWNQQDLFDMVNQHVEECQGRIRLFTLGIGNDASHSLVEGLARAGRGFSQAVGHNERMDKKVIRMLKGALTPHINDYTLQVKYKKPDHETSDADDDDFELIDRVADLAVDVSPIEKPTDKKEEATANPPGEPISLFDPNFDPNAGIESAGVVAPPTPLPAITVPKILQAPSDIPPLYPFNRTSVYLILSPETANKNPESVILRATSKHGPLVLEIPITTTTTGETIHQLAARKAIHELEEGRGWIFSAKEKSNGNGLLKEVYKDQFSAMVEREAVRLGVQFQVAGKWCSFVAVEDDDVVSVSEGNSVSRDSQPVTKRDRDRAAPVAKVHSRKALTQGSMMMRPMSVSNKIGSVGYKRVPQPDKPYYSNNNFDMEYSNLGISESIDAHFLQDVDLCALQNSSYTPAPAVDTQSPSSIPSNPPPPPSAAAAAFGNSGGALFGMASPSPAAPPGVTHRISNARHTLFTPQPSASRSVSFYPMAAQAFGQASPAASAAASKPHETTLQKLTRLQDFSGFWPANAEVVEAIGITEEHVVEMLSAVPVIDGSNGGSAAIDQKSVVITAAVVVFLRKQLASERDAWELVVDKALACLEGIYGNQDIVGAVEKLMA